MNKKIIIPIASVGVFIIIVTIYMMLNNIKYTVTFNTNGGVAVESIEVKKNKTIDKLPITSKEGYTFLYWTLDGSRFNNDTKITKNITLIAYYQKNENEPNEVKTYTVKFNTDGGNEIESIEVEENNTLTKPENPTKTGYTFDKWVLDNKEYDFDTKVTEDITLKAIWKKQEENKKQYTVIFNTDGGSSISSLKVISGNKVTKPTNPIKAGYTFVEWQINGKTYNFNSIVSNDITLTALWRKNEETPVVSEKTKYTVIFDSNGGTSVSSQTIEEGSKVTKPTDPVKDGYTFNGWVLDGNSYDFNSSVTSNITLTASWKEVVKTYTISVSLVDTYSPDRYLTVKENGNPIKISKLMYIDNTEINFGSDGNKISVAYVDIMGETEFKIQLSSGSIVIAKVE